MVYGFFYFFFFFLRLSAINLSTPCLTNTQVAFSDLLLRPSDVSLETISWSSVKPGCFFLTQKNMQLIWLLWKQLFSYTGYDRYYNKYINVKKGGLGGISMVLAGYVVVSYIWSYSHLSKYKQDGWVYSAAWKIAWGNKNNLLLLLEIKTANHCCLNLRLWASKLLLAIENLNAFSKLSDGWYVLGDEENLDLVACLTWQYLETTCSDF